MLEISIKNYSIVVFPFLKTSSPVTIGQQIFRSTDDTDNLSSEQVTCLNEIGNASFIHMNTIKPSILRNMSSKRHGNTL